MPVSATTLRKLMDAGIAGEALIDIIASIDADHASAKPDKERTSGAIRQERYRKRQASQSITNDVTVMRNSDVTSDVTAPPALSPKKVSPTPPSKNNPLPNPQSSLAIANSEREPDEFERWYAHFPNKVGKDAARKAWPKALKKATYPQLCGGLTRYLNKADDRPWCNPATWLNQERWLDEPATAPPKRAPLKGLALVEEQLRQEISNAGFGGEEDTDHQAVARLAFHGR